jgi:predicted cytidylate kinase
MSKPSVITISGEPGTGTTTIATMLSKKTGLRMVYTGETFRELAKEHNMELSEFSTYADSNPKIDLELDARQMDHARKGNVILEGRLAGWLMKNNKIDAFTILLTADLEIRVNRIMGRENKSYNQVKQEILEREKCEMERYQKFYTVNYLDNSHYDLIIDTSDLTPDEIVNKIVNEWSKFAS